jgi:hypothetical protein
MVLVSDDARNACIRNKRKGQKMIDTDTIEKAENVLWQLIIAHGENPNSETAEDVAMQIIEVTNLAYLRGKNDA